MTVTLALGLLLTALVICLRGGVVGGVLSLELLLAGLAGDLLPVLILAPLLTAVLICLRG